MELRAQALTYDAGNRRAANRLVNDSTNLLLMYLSSRAENRVVCEMRLL
jgi:hypothetical protein